MALIWIDRCPLCGVSLKPGNLLKHIERVHPHHSYGVPKVSIDEQKCPFCGEINDPSNTKYGLSICDKHYVTDVRRFLIRDFYLKLKKGNDKELAADPQTTFHMINLQLHMINNLLGWEPEKVEPDRYLAFAETSMLTGYLLLRAVEAVPQIKPIMYSFAESDEAKKAPRSLMAKVAKLMILMDIEFEFFVATKLAASGYFDVAVDNESWPRIILIVPKVDQESIENLLLFRLKDANEQWHGTFRSILVPYGTSTARDEFGTTFSFDRAIIKGNFEVFKETWNDVFHTETRMTVVDFENLWEWLEWVITQDGITERNQNKATHFQDYEGLNLDKDLVFEILNEVLPEVSERLYYISLKELSKSDPNLRMLYRFADLARGFRLSTSKGVSYFFPCRKWFYNKVIPVFVKFARRLELAGHSFEKDITTFSELYSKFGIKLGGKSAISAMIEPSLKERKNRKTSRSIPWRILEREFPIHLPKNDISKKIGTSGKIDLIVYANMNLYLLELKALNLENRHAIQYMREKAPVQSAKYGMWVRNKQEFERFLKNMVLEKTS